MKEIELIGAIGKLYSEWHSLLVEHQSRGIKRKIEIDKRIKVLQSELSILQKQQYDLFFKGEVKNNGSKKIKNQKEKAPAKRSQRQERH